MFYNCYSLVSLIISNFETSNVILMYNMFYNCSSLISLNVSNFNTSGVTEMYGMFYNCSSLKELNLSNFDTSKVINMNNIFNGCSSLVSLYINNFVTSQVNTMRNLFANCFSLVSLDLTNFDVSQVTNMVNMFFDCLSLTSLNLSNFKPKKVSSISGMFNQCVKLTSIDISNFDTSNTVSFDNLFNNCRALIHLNLSNLNTSQVKDMRNMFYNCQLLVSLDISNFDTSQVTDMHNMFYKCFSLTSLNLSNFITSNTTNISQMFNGCHNLEYINIFNFNEDILNKYELIFNTVPENVVICLKNNKSFIQEIENKKCPLKDCTNDYKLKQKKLIKESNKCIDNCLNDNKYKYEFNNKCYDNCLINYNNSFLNICKCDLDQCLLCTKDSYIKGLCTQCNNNFYPKQNDIFNIGIYIKCYNESIKREGYYLDAIDYVYKKCYETCQTCEKEGNYSIHNCLSCKSSFPKEFKFYNFSNCYISCEYYFYFGNSSNYFCTEENICPTKYNKLIKEKKQCIENCSMDNIYKYEFRNECYKECPYPESKIINDNEFFCEAICFEEKPFLLILKQECVENCGINEIKNNLCILKYSNNETIEETKKEKEEIKAKDKLLDNIEKGFTSNEYNTSNIAKKKLLKMII